MPQLLLTVEDYRKLVDKYDTFLFDCDGVIWLGTTIIEGVKESIAFLKSQNKRVVFVTNNSTISRKEYSKKFAGFGMSISKEEIFSSSHATAVHLKNIVKFSPDKKVFVVGGQGVKDELHLANIRFCNKETSALKKPADYKEFVNDPEVGAVICGLDRDINYAKLSIAHLYLTLNKDCLFIATNNDSTYPVGDFNLPGAGSILSVLETSTKRVPTIVGKPYKTLFDCISADYHIEKSRTIMVGDRLNTDVQFGINSGIDTLIVFTGITSEHEAMDPNSTQATYAMTSFGEISKLA
ncbi:hypothetical protein BB561_003392 [Smittium simulii]|uniref:4-nitrophenylphosphatase n=1 Tax=Smittium simulii TaxID=133385 RepID=A0A2T9YLM4_9FUNG|nr:hypothetical protein BB561_003392 [Smittium simulii]